jgi:hypothetical protein
VTWVIGSTTVLGYSVIVADIQVSTATPKGTLRVDGIQKVFPVGPYLAAGFSGNVYLGYRLIGDLQQCLAVPPKGCIGWMPEPVIAEWRLRAKSLFRQWAESDQSVALLIGGAWIREQTVQSEGAALRIPATYMCILRSPDFMEEAVLPMTVKSIGSGNDVETYRVALKAFSENAAVFHSLETGGGIKNGYAMLLVRSLREVINKNPTAGISPHLIAYVVRPGTFAVGSSDSDRSEEDKPMPAIARSFEEVVALLARHGVAGTDAARALATF